MKKLLDLGVSGKLSRTENSKTRIANLFILIGIALSLFFLLLNLVQFPNDIPKHLSLVVAIALLGGCLLLNYRQQHLAARTSLIFFISTLFTINTTLAYRGFYGEYFFLLIPLLCVLFFEKAWIHFISLGAALMLFYLPNWHLNIYEPSHFGYANVFFLFLGVFAIVRYFKKLNQHNEVLLEQQKNLEIVQAQHQMLRSQLNPHFISNAMVAMQTYLIRQDTEAAQGYLHTFSRLMRDILENSRRELVSVGEEAALLKDYLAINQARLNDTFDYAITVEEGIDHDLDSIPPMLVQPFVENALEHGLPRDGRRGQINIAFSRSEDEICITIKDNGKYNPEKHQTNKKSSISTTIIKERIRLYNQVLNQPVKLQLLDRSTVDGDNQTGTLVLLTVPLIE